MCSTAYSDKNKEKAQSNSAFTTCDEVSREDCEPGKQVLLLDPYHQVVMRISVCAVITFLSIVIWWSAWIPVTLGCLAFAGYAMGYRVVVSDNQRKAKLKNEEFDTI